MGTASSNPTARGRGRRDFLKTSFAGTVILVAVGFLARCTRKETVRGTGLATFTDAEFNTLRAFCQTVLPGPDTSEALLATPARIDREVAHWSAKNQAQVRSVLAFIEDGTRYFLFSWRPFTALTTAERQAYLRGWENSGLNIRRQGYQVMRMLALFYYYSQDATWKEIGYDGPWIHRAAGAPGH